MINEIEHRPTIMKINETKNCFFSNINEIVKTPEHN